MAFEFLGDPRSHFVRLLVFVLLVRSFVRVFRVVLWWWWWCYPIVTTLAILHALHLTVVRGNCSCYVRVVLISGRNDIILSIEPNVIPM